MYTSRCVRLNVKSIFFKMTIDGYVLSTELNTSYIYTNYSSLNGPRGRMVSVLSLWFIHPGFKLRLAYFFFQKTNWLIDHWNVPALQSTDWSLNGDWYATEITFPLSIQSPFSHLSCHQSIDWKVGCHPLACDFKFKNGNTANLCSYMDWETPRMCLCVWVK